MKNNLFKQAIPIICAALFAAAASHGQSIGLQLQSDYTVGTAVNSPRFAVGDVNNDGLPDLVTMNQNNATNIGPLSVFLNNGAGGFAAPINIAADLSPFDAVIRDFNRDGFPDLGIASGGLTTGLHIRLGNGTGNFPTGTYINNERASPVIASADFNGDGNHDAAICNNLNELRVLAGNGAGTFAAANVYATANVCQDLITADFNVDGRPDLAVAMRIAPSDRGIQVFLNNGSGFNAPLNVTAPAATEMITADFNRDCVPDIAAAQFASLAVTPIFILIGNGAGGFTSTSVNVNNTPRYMTIGDFNRDKKVDLVLRRNINNNPTANNLTILPGNGAGGFGSPFEASIAPATSSTEMQVASLDADRDGRDDLVVGRQGGFLLYHGSSALFTRTENDFDGDLKTDLSVFRPSLGDWFVAGTTRGLYQQHWGLATDRPAAADYDGDGRTDLAVWRENGYGDPNRSYFFIFQSATGTFRQEQFGRTGDLPTVVGDWDGDGRSDPAVYRDAAAPGAQSFFFYRPSSQPGVDFRAVWWGTDDDEPVRGDFDGDGRQDAALFRPSNSFWYVLKSSDGLPLYQSWGLAGDRRVPADYDGDGRTDFAVFRPTDAIWYVLKSATGTASYRRWGAAADVPVPADYDGDGRSDPAVYRPADQRWYVPACGLFPGVNAKFGASGDVPVPAAP